MVRRDRSLVEVFSVILNAVFTLFVEFIKYLFELLFPEYKMTEGSTRAQRKRKHSKSIHPQETRVHRNLISANWQKLLASNLINDEKKPMQENKNEYKGLFKRERKRMSKLDKNEELNLESLKITKEKNEVDSTVEDQLDFKVQEKPKCKDHRQKSLTKFIAMDCEMVGIGDDGSDHMLARVSLVNKFGDCIYDKFVKPREEVKDYRTSVSGVRREDLLNGEDFFVVQREVAEILKGKVLVGHSLKNDLNVLFLSHPKKNIRDTSKFKPFKKIANGRTPSLKKLAKEVLDIDIQTGEHSSVEDARAAMKLYCMVAKEWESSKF